MWGRETGKTEKKNDGFLSRGILLLVFLILAVQSLLLIFYILRNMAAGPGYVLPLEGEGADTAFIAPEAGVPGHVSESREKKPDGIPSSADRSRKRTPVPKRAPVREEKPQSGKEVESHREMLPVGHYDYDGWKWDRVELNTADSAALDALPGIGPYYARQILRYRERLWGSYADVSQLMDIRGIDTVLMRKLEGRIYVEPSSVKKWDLFRMSEDSLARHPYVGPYAAGAVVRFRELVGREGFTIEALLENKVLTEAQAKRISLYLK